MKLLLSLIFVVTLISPSFSQPLLTYGNHSISKEEFKKAYEKNNGSGGALSTTKNAPSEKDIRNYLDLYIRFKLKVQEAYDLKLDTLVSQQSDVQNFRKQIEEPFLTDEAELKRLTEEAFNRSQKDIHLVHIFIPFRADFLSNPAHQPITSTDSAAAKKKITEAYEKLLKGDEFGTVATAYSMDPAAQNNHGDMGFITVFSLPYSLETKAYTLSPGKISEPFASSAGYHIFKSLGERGALGKIKIAQILIAYDQNGGTAEKAKAKKLADSVYKAIINGAAFDKMAIRFSFDNLTASSGGLMPAMGVSDFEMPFTEAVFALKKNGDVSAPIETSAGYHIVKRLQHIPVEKVFTVAAKGIKQSVDNDKRSALARASFEQKARKLTGMKKAVFNTSALYAYTDSFLLGSTVRSASIDDNTILLEFPKGSATTKEWLKYVSTAGNSNLTEKYPQTWTAFENAQVVEYYRKHLEEYSPEYSQQLKEFMEGNLLFEIMERKVWTVSSSDAVGLKKYYEQHKSAYTWKKSADAIIVNAADSATAVKTRKLIAAKPSSWKKIAAAAEGNVLADSGRIEWSQIPAVPAAIVPGMMTKVMVNEDNTASFTYVLKTYTQTSPRSFEDARGLVMNDYQKEIEEKWILALKQKYPVVVNEAVLRSIW